jgi:ring-1,2-phenylacetyl-CoA epoxidase subunit PaaC
VTGGEAHAPNGHAPNEFASDERARVEYLLRLGDSDLVLGQRLIAWIGHAPVLEEELAIGNVALDLIGQARLWLSYAAEREAAGRDEDALAYFRQAHEFRNVLLAERPNDDFAVTMTRQFFYDVWHLELLRALSGSNDERIAAIAAKGAREVSYHVERSREWVVRLGDGTAESNRRMRRAVDLLWPYTGELFAPDAVDEAGVRAGWGCDAAALRAPWLAAVEDALTEATLALPPADAWMHAGGKSGRHSEDLSYLLAEMQSVRRSVPGATW